MQLAKLSFIMRLPLLIALGLAAGCGRSEKPDAIWQPPDIRPLIYPRGIAYSPLAKEFFVVDRVARIQRINSTGHFVNEWQMPEQEHGRPVGISIGPDGNVYVPDTHYHRVIVYTPDGKELRRWGSFGTGPSQFIYLTDVAFDAKGRVFVSEYGDNDRVQVFTPDGQWLYQFGSFGPGDGQFSRPQSMVIDGDLVYITDACNHRIVVFTIDGKWVRSMGSLGSEPGQFRFPYGLDQDTDRNLIVTEFGNSRVQKIDRESGKAIWVWGKTGRNPGELAYPWAAVSDHAGRIVVVDSGNNRLQILSHR